MRKKILSIYLAVAIGFLSLVASAVPAYASSSPEWSDYFEITYSSSDINSPYSLEFKDSKAQVAYKNLSKDERKKIDYDAFMAISAKDQNHKFGNLVFNNTTIPDLIKGIASSAGMVMSGKPDSTGFNADLQDKLTRISNSISASNRKFGGKGISRKASSTHPNNFGLGTLTLSKGFINELRSQIAKFDGYSIYPALSEDQQYYLNYLGDTKVYAGTKEFDTYFPKFVSRHEMVFKSTYRTTVSSSTDGTTTYNHPALLFVYGSPNYYKDSNGTVYAIEKSDTGIYSSKLSTSGRLSYLLHESYIEFSYRTGSSDLKYLTSDNFLGCIGLYTILFDSFADAQRYYGYLTGQSVSNYFISSNPVTEDYSTTINKFYDYSEKSNDTYQTIINNVTNAISDNSGQITEEQYRQIVNEVMKKVQTEIDSQPDSGDSGGSSGGDSGNTGGGSGGDSGNTGGGESDTWLEKIYNRLGDVLKKIGTVTGVDTLVSLVQQIADDIKTLKEGGTLSADFSDTNGLLKDIKKLLGTLIAVQAAGDVADLLTDTVGDKISDFVDNLKSGVSEVTDALQDVFPFSIPWDLMTILALFAAEPEAPVFDIPVHLGKFADQTIHVDLSDFESVSVICRAFLSISFAVGLMYLTIRLTGGGKDDD